MDAHDQQPGARTTDRGERDRGPACREERPDPARGGRLVGSRQSPGRLVRQHRPGPAAASAPSGEAGARSALGAVREHGGLVAAGAPSFMQARAVSEVGGPPRCRHARWRPGQAPPENEPNAQLPRHSRSPDGAPEDRSSSAATLPPPDGLTPSSPAARSTGYGTDPPPAGRARPRCTQEDPGPR